jgi:glycerophosphoryl diester phosphodiesterase
MIIISHRGYWKKDEEKNTREAFSRSFALGFGTETDVRDYNEKLVISHDIATNHVMGFADFLSLASVDSVCGSLILALNIKADGLAEEIKKSLDQYSYLSAFVFDMSVPDMRSYFDIGIPVFTRISEIEQEPVWLEQSEGVWLDAFTSNWFDNSVIERFLKKNKRVSIVSSELHHRDHLVLWEQIKSLRNEKNLLLCTDYPEEARNFFEVEE